MNYVLALVVYFMLCVWVAAEMGWGGSRSYDWRKHMPRDPLWIRWRRAGLYPPEPKSDDPGPAPTKPRPKLPETVE